MRNQVSATERINRLLEQQERGYKWLHRQTGISYGRILRVLKHRRQPLTFEDAAVIADALGVDLPVLAYETEEAA